MKTYPSNDTSTQQGKPLRLFPNLIYGIIIATMAAIATLSPPVFAQENDGDPLVNGEIIASDVTGSSVGSDKAEGLWWFHGWSPQNYNIELILTDTQHNTTPFTGTWDWTIIQGANIATLSDGTTTGAHITKTNDNTVLVKSIGASVIPDDVVVEVKYNGTAFTHFKLTVLTAKDVVRPVKYGIVNGVRQIVDPGYQDSPDPGGNGYRTTYHYHIRDQFTNTLPKYVDLNEDWGTLVSDYAGNNWTAWQADGSPTTESGGPVNPSDFTDTLTRVDPPASVPKPLEPPVDLNNPAAGSSTVKVNHRPGQIKIGSGKWRPGPDNNDGYAIMSLTWQIYQDHARHENVVSPATQ